MPVHDEEVKIAYLEALKSPLKSKYGAVLSYRGRIISTGYNDDRKMSSITSLNRCCLL